MNSTVDYSDDFNLFWQKDITLHFRTYMIKDKEIPIHLFLSIPEEVRCTGGVPYWEPKAESLAEFKRCIEHSVNIIKGNFWEFYESENT